MNKQVSTLLEKQMTRKEFMATLGFGAATVFGFGSIIKVLTGAANPTTSRVASGQKSASRGYGSSAYGG